MLARCDGRIWVPPWNSGGNILEPIQFMCFFYVLFVLESGPDPFFLFLGLVPGWNFWRRVQLLASGATFVIGCNFCHRLQLLSSGAPFVVGCAVCHRVLFFSTFVVGCCFCCRAGVGIMCAFVWRARFIFQTRAAPHPTPPQIGVRWVGAGGGCATRRRHVFSPATFPLSHRAQGWNNSVRGNPHFDKNHCCWCRSPFCGVHGWQNQPSKRCLITEKSEVLVLQKAFNSTATCFPTRTLLVGKGDRKEEACNRFWQYRFIPHAV